jgi:hypothetical protein
MTDLASIVKEATGDRNIRHRDADQHFARVELSDTCIDAANRTARRFDRSYPGWALYSRIVRGDTVFDRQLAAWAIACARRYARARKVNGQAVVAPRGRRNDWIAQAALDALDYTITGDWHESAYLAATRVGVKDHQYAKFRSSIAAMMMDGFEQYRAELHYQHYRVRRDECNANYFGPTVGMGKSPFSMEVRGIDLGLSANGCYITPPTGDPDKA